MPEPRRPRVLQVGKFFPPHRGGMESHLADLCRALAPRYDLAVLVAADGPATVRETAGGLTVTRVGTRATIASTPITPGMTGEIRRFGKGLVHVHLPHPWAVLSYLRSGHRGPLVATHHSDIVRQRWLRLVFAPLLDRFFARCAAILVSSPPYLASSAQLARWQDRCRVVPFGIDPRPFTHPDPGQVAEIRRRFGPGLVLGIGRQVYYKGFEHLVAAVARVPAARLVLLGEGPLHGALARQVAAAGLGERVTLAGAVGDVAPWLAAAHVLALPSVARSEAFGIVQLEAMAAGTPVVNTALDSGVPWVSPHEETGLTVPPADPEALAAALARLLADEPLRHRLGEAGRRRVAERFTLERMGQEVAAVYDEAFGNGDWRLEIRD